MVKQAFTSIALIMAMLLVLASCGEEGQIESQSNDLDDAAEVSALSEVHEDTAVQEAPSSESTEPTYMLRTKTMIQYPTSSEDTPFLAMTSYSYDAQGNLLEEQYESHGNDRDRAYSTTYSYDESGNILSEECPAWDDLTLYTYDAHGTLTAKSEATRFGTFYYEYLAYDEAGRPTTVVERYSEENKRENAESGRDEADVITWKYSYDAAGHTVSETKIYSDAQGVLYTSTITREYNPESGLLLQEIEDYTGRSLFYKTTTSYTYDSWGNVLRKEITDQNGNTSYLTHTYTYDLAGNVLTDTCTQVSGTLISYASNGEVTNYQYYPNVNSTPTVTNYSYDASGNCIATLNFASFGITQNSYLYDSHGNLIQEENGYYASDGSTQQSRVVTSYEYIAVP